MSGKPESMRELLERAVQSARERKTPSERNRRIADEVWVNGRTQVEVAAEYRLSQRRVSQICQQVEAWQAQTQAWDRGQTCGTEEKQVENELQKRQLTEIYRRSMRAFTRSERPLVSRRSRKCAGDEQWSEEHEREQRLDTGSLRVAMRALQQRAKLTTRNEPGEGYTSDHRVRYLEWILQSLSRYRRDAEQRGDVLLGQESSDELVERLVRELLGGKLEASGVSEHSDGDVAPAAVETHREADASRSPEVAASADPTTAGDRSRRLDGETRPETQPSATNQPRFDFGEKRLGYFGQTNLRQEMANHEVEPWLRLNWTRLLIRQQSALLGPDGENKDLRKEIDDSNLPIEARLTAALKLLDRQTARLEAASRSSNVRAIEERVEEPMNDSGVALSDASAEICYEATIETAAVAGAENLERRRASHGTGVWPLREASGVREHPDGAATPTRLETHREADTSRSPSPSCFERAQRQRQARARLEHQFGSAMSDEQIAEELEFLRRWELGRPSMFGHSREQREALIEWRQLTRRRNTSARIQPSI